MESRRCLNQGVLERISKIIGDTNDGLSGSEIAYFLKQCNYYWCNIFKLNFDTPFVNKGFRAFFDFLI